VKSAYTCGTPAFGVGAGNVAGIVDKSADIDATAERVCRSKTFDNATSCSSENHLVLLESVRERMLSALEKRGAIRLHAAQKAQLQQMMWPDGKLSAAATGQSARVVAQRAGLDDVAQREPSMLLVDEDGFGPDHPFSGEKLCPVLTIYTARDFDHAMEIVSRIYDYQGAGHSVGLHSQHADRAMQLGLHLPVSRVIVNQAHCIATGGSFDNGLPFSLSMGCGTWGGNNFSENMNVRHYMNITRISRPIAERMPTEHDIFSALFDKYGQA